MQLLKTAKYILIHYQAIMQTLHKRDKCEDSKTLTLSWRNANDRVTATLHRHLYFDDYVVRLTN